MEKKGGGEEEAASPLLDITRFPSRRFRLQLWRAISVRRTGYVSRNFSNYCVITPVINYTYRDNTARRARISFTRLSRLHARVSIIFLCVLPSSFFNLGNTYRPRSKKPLATFKPYTSHLFSDLLHYDIHFPP